MFRAKALSLVADFLSPKIYTLLVLRGIMIILFTIPQKCKECVLTQQLCTERPLFVRVPCYDSSIPYPETLFYFFRPLY